MPNAEPFTVTFTGARTARVVRVTRDDELVRALHALGLSDARPTVALVGGAGGLAAADHEGVRTFFAEVLIPLADELGAYVVDGGTQAGVMRLMGEGRAAGAATFPLIGVAAAGTVALPRPRETRLPPDAAPLEPHHTHFVLVPGEQWGDESPWLAAVVGALAGSRPSVTVLVNGGEVALNDVAHSVRAGRPVFVVTGSGRTADLLAAALRGAPSDSRVRRLTASGLIRASDPQARSSALAKSLSRVLAPE